MMCPHACDSPSPIKTDGIEMYNLENGVDALSPLEDEAAFLLQDKEGKVSRRNSICRVFDSNGLGVDHKQRSSAAKKLKSAIAVCLVFMVLEFVGGICAGSLAVLADAAHMSSDVAGFAISLLALRASGWLATPQKTFGYVRLEVLGALVSIQIIWVMTGVILYEAVKRLYYGVHIVDGRLMFSVALVGLILNLIMIFVLGHDHGHHHHGDGGHCHGHLHFGHDNDHWQNSGDEKSLSHKSGHCNAGQRHEHDHHMHHDDHHQEQRLDNRHVLDFEREHRVEEHRNCHSGSGGSCCTSGGPFIQNENYPYAENAFPTSELTICHIIVEDSHIGSHQVDLEVPVEDKSGLPTDQTEAHPATFAGKGEKAGQMKNLDDAGHLPAAEGLSSGRELNCSRDGANNINLQGAYLHALGDLIQNIGVLITGLVIWFKPEWQYIDVVCSFVFSILVILTTGRMLKDIIWVLMECAPRDLDVQVLTSGLLQISGVSAVLDLHLWALTPGTNILSCHLEINPGAVPSEVLQDATDYCYNVHQIKHVTIQIENGP